MTAKRSGMKGAIGVLLYQKKAGRASHGLEGNLLKIKTC